MRNAGKRPLLRWMLAVAGIAILGAAIAQAIPFYATLRVTTGFISHTLCSETFVSGLDPDAVYAEALLPMPGIGKLASVIAYRVDRTAATVTTNIAGIATSRAVYRGPAGCLVERGRVPAPAVTATTDAARSPALEPEILTAAQQSAIDAAIDSAFEEPDAPPHRYTKAVVVLHDGRLVAERYAPGVQATTPLLSWSVAKTVVNALLGILVRDGRLSLQGPAPIAEWKRDDARRSITIEHLMRMTSGLALDENHSGRDPSSQLLFLSHDMGRDAVSAQAIAEPGQRWSYSSGGYLVLSRIVRDTVGGTEEAVRRFAEHELFAPLGMRSVTLETDAVGTPVGSSFVLATARDWARFGELFATDGVVGGRRILPAGWIAVSATPTLNTGYGAGVWTNDKSGKNLTGTTLWSLPGVPTEVFSARGLLGQFIVVVPSRHIVVVRFGHAHTPGADIEGVGKLVAGVLAALPPAQ